MGRIAVPRYLIIIVALVAGLWLIERIFQILYRIADILLIFGLAWLLKLLLDPLIRRLESLRVPRGAAIAIAYLLVLGGLISGITWLVPQLTVLATTAPRLVRLLAARTTEIAESLQQFGLEVDPTALTNQITGAGAELASMLAARVFVLAQSIAGGIGRVVLVITVSVYMSLTSGRMTDVIRPVIPPRWRDEYDVFMRDVKSTYSSYIRGYFYMVALGTFTSGLLLYGLNVPNALLWLLAVFLFRLLPFIGGVLANSLVAIVFALTLPLGVAIIAIALLLNMDVPGGKFFRAVFYLPNVLAGVAAVFLWKWILAPNGLFNRALELIGLSGPGWFVDPFWTKPGLVIMGMWWIGGNILIYLAGLKGIPQQLYEAAEIDGASAWKQTWHITLPMLSPTIFFQVVTGIIGTFQIFTTAYIITGDQSHIGGPGQSLLFYVLYLYNRAFGRIGAGGFQMGYAAAMAWVLFVIILAITLVQLWLARRWVYYETEGR